MINAVLYDVGGTLHTVQNNNELRVGFCERLIARLADYGITLEISPEEFAPRLHELAEEYKAHSEQVKREFPQERIWSEYYLRDFGISAQRIAPYVEELSFLYDYSRVKNVRRPLVRETIEEIDALGIKQGIISNIISTSFVPHILKEYGIEQYMKCVVMSSQTGIRKPAPEIFDYARDLLGGVPANETVYVGDTLSRDVLGARNAGLACVIQINNPAIAHRDKRFVNTGLEPDYFIEDFAEISAIVKNINNL